MEDITTIKNHLFYDSVLKDTGYGVLDSDYEIAVAWIHLLSVEYYNCDILLLEHELFESTYYNYFHSINGCTLRDAHQFATDYYDWEGYLAELFEKLGF